MTDRLPKPTADPVDPEDAVSDPAEIRDPEAPDGDVLDQRQTTMPSGDAPLPDPLGTEATEADLVDQARVVELEEDEEP